MSLTYLIHSPSLKRVKIGVTTNLQARFRTLHREYGPDLECLKVWEEPAPKRLEPALHYHYRRMHLPPPVACLEGTKTGAHEWFEESVLDTILSLDLKAVVKEYEATRLYEIRVPVSVVEALKARGMTLEDALLSLV